MAKKKTASTVPTMVPLDEQVTEIAPNVFVTGPDDEHPVDSAGAPVDAAEVLVPIPESSGDAAVAQLKPVLTIDATAPWAQWPDPDVLNTKIQSISVRPRPDEGLELLGETGDVLGSVQSRGMQQLGWAAQFPGEFIQKLSPATAAQVINERLQAQKDREISLVFESGQLVNQMPGYRGVASYADVAQTAHNALRTVYGDAVELGEARQGDGQMLLRLLTGISEPVTPKRGDVLQMGIQIEHNYGLGIQTSLYVNRLVCLNGMTAESKEYSWRSRNEGTIEHQLAWLTVQLGEVVGAYNGIVQRARLMAETPITGDPEKALQEYARAMRFSPRMLPHLLDAYREEPDATQWGLLNAFTRVATHTLHGSARRAFQAASGQWTQDFDMVTARLPRPVAVNTGAEIIEAE